MNMKQWLEDLKKAPCKKALPVLSFPCIRLMGITVRELIADSDLQARGMKLVADRVDAAASVSMMDLSVEAEAFGARIQVSDDEVPTVVGALVTDEQALRLWRFLLWAPDGRETMSGPSKRPASLLPTVLCMRESSAPSLWRDG